jgi:hypothetical protein
MFVEHLHGFFEHIAFYSEVVNAYAARNLSS